VNRDELQQHMISTYQYLRLGLGGIAFGFPLLLWIVGRWWYGIPPQGSLSAYYFAAPDPGLTSATLRDSLAGLQSGAIDYFLYFLAQSDAQTPMRSWFVGALFVIGVSLFLYEGFTTRENLLLNVAGFSALGVAVFPMGHNCEPNCPTFTLHGLFAVLTFVLTACVAIFCARETLQHLPDPAAQERYGRWYQIVGGAMIVLPLMAFAFSGPLGYAPNVTFYVEVAGTWAFAAFWLLKSLELKASLAERRILSQQPPPEPGGKLPA
jgi:hypothetical protein